MVSSRILTGLLLLAETAVAVPHLRPRQDGEEAAACTNPRVRRPWHKLTDKEKKAYIDAEICLMTTPAKLDIRGAKTRFDELQSVHMLQTEIRHFTGSFLPFHRLMMWTHEEMLVNDCGYEGAQVYWAEQLDAGNFLGSPVLDPETGFGGNGVGEARCLGDGPFAPYNNTLGPGYAINNHCIDRAVNEQVSSLADYGIIDRCHSTTTFVDFWNCLEGTGPHSAGHRGIGGTMSNPVSSPGDPIFYLHHTWLDQLWWAWQKEDLETRLTEIGGRNVLGGGGGGGPGSLGGRPGNLGGDAGGDAGGDVGGDAGSVGGAGGFGGFGRGRGGGDGGGFFGLFGRPDDVPAPVPEGDPGSIVTLSHKLSFYGLVPNMTVADVMDITARLCYDYEDPE